MRYDQIRKEIALDVACSADVFLGGRNLVRVRIVVATIFDFMTVEDWGEWKY